MPALIEPVVLEGRHVRLVPLTLAHVPALLAAGNVSRETYGFTVVPATEATMTSYVETALREQREGRSVPFATLEAASSRVVGCTRFAFIEHWDWPAEVPPDREAAAAEAVEIGWTWLSATAQRTGINTEAKLLMLTHAFETWRVYRVHLKTDSRNVRSRAAIERLGAKFDGILRAHSPASEGGVRDAAWYSILDGEWPEVKERLAARLEPAAAATLG